MIFYLQGREETISTLLSNRNKIADLFLEINTSGDYSITSIKVFLKEIIFPEQSQNLIIKSHSYIQQLHQLDPIWFSYITSTIYTRLINEKLRSSLGIFYTPPILVKNLLDTLENQGVDWAASKIIDPACGGGAFLVPLAERILNKLNTDDPSVIEGHLQRNLKGIDIDPIGAWLSEQLLRKYLNNLYPDYAINIDPIVECRDTLSLEATEQYDLVVGNPPYGKVSLNNADRIKWKDSLYGHANYYGLFAHQAINFLKPKGQMAFIMPASFLGGKYFKKLRHMFLRKCKPVNIDFIKSREDVFPDVLQEVCISYYKKDTCPRPYIGVKYLHVSEHTQMQSIQGGKYLINGTSDQPWFIPRSPEQSKVLQAATKMKLRLSDLGYKVSTGPLVWNRHKDKLTFLKESKSVPVIWAECIHPNNNGVFRYKCEGRNHFPWYNARPVDSNVTSKKCLLIQRTTSVEQNRRIVSVLLPESFLEKNSDGFAIENHLNMVLPKRDTPLISLGTINYFFNSLAVDLVFRCINGSTAVSAFELESIPFPDLEYLLKVEELKDNSKEAEIFNYINRLYSLDNDTEFTIHRSYQRTA